jgi:hypothetical protein
MGRLSICRHNGSTVYGSVTFIGVSQWPLPDTAYVLEEISLPLLTDF